MPIMATHDRSDARGTAHLLATMALDCIGNPSVAEEQEVVLNNVYRLLEAFRTNSLGRIEPPTPLSGEAARDRLSLRRPPQRRLKEVRDAFAAALLEGFPNLKSDDAVRTIEDVLRFVAYPKKAAAKPSADAVNGATAFFEALVKNLAAA